MNSGSSNKLSHSSKFKFYRNMILVKADYISKPAVNISYGIIQKLFNTYKKEMGF